jgi:hypothetical protein
MYLCMLYYVIREEQRSPDNTRSVRVGLQDVIGPFGEVADGHARELRVARDFGRQLAPHECDDAGDLGVGEALGETFASD